MPNYQTARTVTDSFSLRKLIRKHTPQNGRKYLLDAVAAVISSPLARERMALGEMFGYYGHGRREQHYKETGDLRLPEFTTMIVDGKPIQLNNVPASRTVDITLNGDIVTHTQEILSTETGDIVNSMEAGSIGGWSWVTAGPDRGLAGAIARKFEGLDYVTTPNFISINKNIAMLESAGDRELAIIAQLRHRGFSDNACVDIAHHFEHMRESAMLESVVPYFEGELLQLEGRLLEAQQKEQQYVAMMEAAQQAETVRLTAQTAFIETLPLFFSKEQRIALENLNTPQDFQILSAMLEAARQPLPGQNRAFAELPARIGSEKSATLHYVQPGNKAPRFG